MMKNRMFTWFVVFTCSDKPPILRRRFFHFRFFWHVCSPYWVPIVAELALVVKYFL